LSVVVVLATPPFWLANAMTLALPTPMLDWSSIHGKAVSVGIRISASRDSCVRTPRSRCTMAVARRRASSARLRLASACRLRRRGRRRQDDHLGRARARARRARAKVAVVTIDPARRLASALGLERALWRAPSDRSRAAVRRAGRRDEPGELWAMMLDTKRTFDEIVTRLAPDERAREEILANPVYRELSTAVAGSQELGAIAKLYELPRRSTTST
jgi:hypothetical protein